MLESSFNVEVEMFAVSEMPTKLKKVAIVLAPELEEALENYARRSKRSLSNSASILLEQALIMTGDLTKPVDRKESRGGKRPNSGRRKTKKTDEQPDTDV